MSKPNPRGLPRQELRLMAILAIGAFLVFARTFSNGFTILDDPEYVTANESLRNGLTGDGIWWALTSVNYFYWQPVTWLSHMLDISMFGLAPGGHHFTNTLIHALNVALVFLIVRRYTAALWRSVLVAALFAFHPLRVESVAWVAERKDLLCAFFFLLTLLAYERYVRTPNRNRYLTVLALFLLSLAAKPMAVTLPFLLLLLDFWPLQRAAAFLTLAKEKIPMMLLTIAVSAITFSGQRASGAMDWAETTPLSDRIANAAVSYSRYLGKIFWPDPLAVLYPIEPLPVAIVAASAAFVLLITAVCFAMAKRAPWALTGWGWFAGMLVPVLGIVQVGAQAYADRFAYLPSIGLLIAIVWTLHRLLPAQHHRNAWIAGATLAAIGAAVSFAQQALWVDSVTLFQHALAVTRNNSLIENNLASIYINRKQAQQALPLLDHAIASHPDYLNAHLNRGKALHQLGRAAEAAASYSKALAIVPTSGEARYMTAVIHMEQGRKEEAAAAFQSALQVKLDPSQAASAHNSLGIMLAQAGKPEQAVEHFRAALGFDPRFIAAHRNLTAALIDANRGREAVQHLRFAITLTGNRELQQLLQSLGAQ